AAVEGARPIRSLVVSGDVVDGIGVSPRQDEELTSEDIYGQYEALARMIAALPDRLAVVMLPGNHDAVRPAEPQPAFPMSIQKLFDSNVIFAGNPSLLSLEGVRVLAYHGRSMDDLVSAIPGLSYQRPLDGMKAMLRLRHLAPIYGGKTPIGPEAEDHLIIDAACVRRPMRLAAVGDIHGHENLAAVAADLDRLGPVDLVLLAGDTTDRNDLEAYGAVLQTVRSRISAPIAAVFGNNEYANDHPAYVARFGAAHH